MSSPNFDHGFAPLPPAPAKQKNWFVRHKIITGFLGLVVIGSAISAAAGGGAESETVAQSGTSSSSPSVNPAKAESGNPATKTDDAAEADEAKVDNAATAVTDAEDAAEQPAAEEPAAAPAEPEMTTSQKNAVRAAENYLDFTAFSRLGLIRQLSSSAGDGYSKADATFAVDHIEVNWNEQAYKAAQNYLDLMSFSRAGLIQQLTSSAGDQYTRAQATYAVDKVGL